MSEAKDLGPTDIGLQANLAGLLCYLPFFIGLILSIVFIVMEKQNKFVRFHALQSILFCVAMIIIGAILAVIPIIGWITMPLIGILAIILVIILMIKAYQGEKFKLPVIGEIAEKNS
ncbi:MAG: DUF4870 domain-containing protein [Candidatus Omnitrophica bacterium]|nr:DUF4870 domain-containing protein [Candidatus Omnitrophota bacterium]